MKKNLNLLLSSALVALTLSIPQKTQGMEEDKTESSLLSLSAPLTTTYIMLPSNKQIVMQLNRERYLSDLREELGEEITSHDVFLHDGHGVWSRDEAILAIHKIIKDNILSFQPREAEKPSESFFSILSTTLGMSPAPKTDAHKRRKTVTHEITPASLVTMPEPPKLLSSDNSTSEANTTDYIKLLLSEAGDDIIRRLCLRKTIDITVTESKKEVDVNPSDENSIEWTAPADWREVAESTMDTDHAFSKFDMEFKKSRISNVSTSTSYFGIGGDIEYETNHANLKSNVETEIYLLAMHYISKYVVSIPLSAIKATCKFEEAIENVLYNGHTQNIHDIKTYEKLIDVLSQYGFYVATKFHLGGQIWRHDRTTVKSTADIERVKSEFGSDLSASIKAASISLGGGTANETTTTTRTAESREVTNQKVKGGDVNKKNNIGEWIKSLDDHKKWQVIQWDGFRPVIDVLSPELRKRCTSLIEQYYNSEKRIWTLEGMREAAKRHKALMKEAAEKYKVSMLLENHPRIKHDLKTIDDRINLYNRLKVASNSRRVNQWYLLSEIKDLYKTTINIATQTTSAFANTCNSIDLGSPNQMYAFTGIELYEANWLIKANIFTKDLDEYLRYSLSDPALSRWWLTVANLNAIIKFIKEDLHRSMELFKVFKPYKKPSWGTFNI